MRSSASSAQFKEISLFKELKEKALEFHQKSE